MGNQIHINRVAERFSSHTQIHARPRRHGSSADKQALREQLIETLVEVLAEGGDPRLTKSRAQL